MSGTLSCDVAIAWTLFSGASRETYREELAIDPARWARGRGWTLWKQLITLAEYRETDHQRAATAHTVLNEIFAEYAEPATAHRLPRQAIAGDHHGRGRTLPQPHISALRFPSPKGRSATESAPQGADGGGMEEPRTLLTGETAAFGVRFRQ